ncbi:hypothetical protein BCU54_009995 [Vibrio lentus]|nr:hypothetical protein [Vibrio lentus]PMH96013.1 hypothetical protein BCU54_12085 [Vibrio lentus]
MKLEKALSLEIDSSITASQADELYKKSIFSKFKFECPDPKCDAQVTCANLDKKKEKRKRDPYFKVVGLHSSDCQIAKDQQQVGKTKRVHSDIYSDSDEFFDNAVRFNVQEPSSAKPTDDTPETSDEEAREVRTKLGDEDESRKRKIQRSKTLSSMVDSYLKGENFDVQLPNVGVIKLQDLFVKLDGNQLGDFEDEFRVYFAEAYINKRTNGGFSVNFAAHVKDGEEEKKLSFLITDEVVERYPFKKYQRSVLEKLSNKNRKTIYILSETGPFINNRNNEYANFWIESLMFMECRF